MDTGELHHLLFRWLHVTTAVLWIGHTWSLVFAQHVRQPTADLWMRGSAAATALTGIALLIFVYYAGGALTTPSQSLWMAVGVGVSVVLLTWLLYDAVWTLLANRPAVAAVVSLLLVGGIAQGLAEFMTGRAVFIHVGATLGTILLNKTNQRPQRIVAQCRHRARRDAVHGQQSLPAHLWHLPPLARRPAARGTGMRGWPLAALAVAAWAGGSHRYDATPPRNFVTEIRCVVAPLRWNHAQA